MSDRPIGLRLARPYGAEEVWVPKRYSALTSLGVLRRLVAWMIALVAASETGILVPSHTTCLGVWSAPRPAEAFRLDFSTTSPTLHLLGLRRSRGGKDLK
jgi:hypothetical protein